MTSFDVLHLDLDQFTDPCAGSGHEADHKVPEQLAITLQAGFEVLVVFLADNILQEGFLLYSNKRHLPFVLADALQVTVDRSKTKVNRLGFVAFDQPYLVGAQVLQGDSIVLLAELFYSKEI